jgi:hypothetical protein
MGTIGQTRFRRMKASWNDRPYAGSNSASRKTQYIETYQFGVIFDAFSFSHDHDHGNAANAAA